MVIAIGVEDQFAEELAGGGVDDAGLEVLDEQDDAGSGVGSSDADVVEATVVAQGHASGSVDGVVTDSVVGVVGLNRHGEPSRVLCRSHTGCGSRLRAA